MNGMLKWHQQTDAALTSLAAAIGSRGQWPGAVFQGTISGNGQRDIASPLTALGMLALQGLPLTGVAELLQHSRQHLELTVLPGGLWRYYANIPPDTDDTAMCALALGLEHPLVSGRTAPSLLATRLADGRFPTWFETDWRPVVDTVPNAHVVAVLGPGPATAAAVAWLLEVVADGREVAEAVYYPDPLDLHVALTRAVAAGVTDLRPAVETAARRALERLQREELTDYRTAQAIIVAAAAANPDRRLLPAAAEMLAGSAEPTGGWAADTLFVAKDTNSAGLFYYQSRAVVTALCLRALVVAAITERS